MQYIIWYLIFVSIFIDDLKVAFEALGKDRYRSYIIVFDGPF